MKILRNAGIAIIVGLFLELIIGIYNWRYLFVDQFQIKNLIYRSEFIFLILSLIVLFGFIKISKKINSKNLKYFASASFIIAGLSTVLSLFPGLLTLKDIIIMLSNLSLAALGFVLFKLKNIKLSRASGFLLIASGLIILIEEILRYYEFPNSLQLININYPSFSFLFGGPLKMIGMGLLAIIFFKASKRFEQNP